MNKMEITIVLKPNKNTVNKQITEFSENDIKFITEFLNHNYNYENNVKYINCKLSDAPNYKPIFGFLKEYMDNL